MISDNSNPLVVNIPHIFNTVNEYPTEILITRFQSWRYIIKNLIIYFQEFSSIQKEDLKNQKILMSVISKYMQKIPNHKNQSIYNNSKFSTQNDLNRKNDFENLNNFFLSVGSGSVQDIPSLFSRFHEEKMLSITKISKDVNKIIIPRLEELRRDLLVKIKEIKSLQNDFKNNVYKELVETKFLINQYLQSIDSCNKSDYFFLKGVENQKNDFLMSDPYIVRLKLDRQLQKQIKEENMLYDAYVNLQNAGGKLESILFEEIQRYLSDFFDLLQEENRLLTNFFSVNQKNSFLSKDPYYEWNSFIKNNLATKSSFPISFILPRTTDHSTKFKTGSFIDISIPVRNFSDLKIPNHDSVLNVPIKEGFLERKSRYLKNYTLGWYVLTCNFLHEFKTSNRKNDLHPVLSLPLNYCIVSDNFQEDGSEDGVYKLILTTKQVNGLIHKNHSWIFRTNTYKNMMEWYNTLRQLTTLPSSSTRAIFLNKKKNLAGQPNKTCYKYANDFKCTDSILKETNSRVISLDEIKKDKPRFRERSFSDNYNRINNNDLNENHEIRTFFDEDHITSFDRKNTFNNFCVINDANNISFSATKESSDHSLNEKCTTSNKFSNNLNNTNTNFDLHLQSKNLNGQSSYATLLQIDD